VAEVTAEEREVREVVTGEGGEGGEVIREEGEEVTEVARDGGGRIHIAGYVTARWIQTRDSRLITGRRST
jgi:hypothetical protein